MHFNGSLLTSDLPQDIKIDDGVMIGSISGLFHFVVFPHCLAVFVCISQKANTFTTFFLLCNCITCITVDFTYGMYLGRRSDSFPLAFRALKFLSQSCTEFRCFSTNFSKSTWPSTTHSYNIHTQHHSGWVTCTFPNFICVCVRGDKRYSTRKKWT